MYGFLHRLERHGSVYLANSLGVLLKALQIMVSDAVKKILRFLFKTILSSSRSGALHSDGDGRIQQQRHIRLQRSLNPFLKDSNSLLRHPATPTLVGITGVRKTITQDPVPLLEGR